MRFGTTGLAAALVLLVGVSGCQREDVAQTSYTTTEKKERSENVVNDATITTRVKAALLAQSDISGQDIKVESEGGRVTLTGQVPAPQIERATAVVRGVDGVTEVINKLTAAGGAS